MKLEQNEQGAYKVFLSHSRVLSREMPWLDMAAVLRLVGEGERESRKRDHWGVIAVIQMRDNSGSDQGNSGKGGWEVARF